LAAEAGKLFTVIQGFLGDPPKRVFLFIRKLQLILHFTNGFQADKSGIAFDKKPDCAELHISDRGAGFSADAHAVLPSLGVAGMKARAEAMWTPHRQLQCLPEWRRNSAVLCGQRDDHQQSQFSLIKTEPDIILMDLSMPDMDGIEAAKIAAERFPDISIDNFNVFLSGEEIAQSFADNVMIISNHNFH
jgi:CheY-like chemotaxis protein